MSIGTHAVYKGKETRFINHAPSRVTYMLIECLSTSQVLYVADKPYKHANEVKWLEQARAAGGLMVERSGFEPCMCLAMNGERERKARSGCLFIGYQLVLCSWDDTRWTCIPARLSCLMLRKPTLPKSSQASKHIGPHPFSGAIFPSF